MERNATPPPAQSPLSLAADAKERTRFVVVLEGEAGADTAHIRTLRFLLKYLLRSRSLRCIEARQVDPLPTQREDAEPAPSTGGSE
jgi:hypothetical protein